MDFTMESVIIITRDINGKRNKHYLAWDEVATYVRAHINNNRDDLQDDEILMILVDGTCVYSELMCPDITWDDVVGFFS